MTRVAIVGAGPSGLAQLHAFEKARTAGAEIPEIVCFEKQPDWGGLWNYTWRTGLDSWGEAVHGSMYRYLWSNGPKEVMEFADYSFEEHFGKPIPSFPPREVLSNYLTGRAAKHNLRRYITFNTAVRWVAGDPETGGFLVTVASLPDGRTRTESFDYVIICTGHFSTPNVPEFEGFDRFPGRVLHSHDFRNAQEFAGKSLLVIGGSYSAEDIALQSLKYGARSVTISYRTAPMSFAWPEGIEEVPLLTHIDGSTAHFADGSLKDIDAVVLCTGYQHSFPFMEEALRLRTANELYPEGLYKGVFWIANPKVMYLGMQDQYYTFTFFDTQAWYARDVVLGRLVLPACDEMVEDVASWRGRQHLLAGPSDDIDFQADHLAALAKDVDYPAFDLDLTRQHLKTWEHDKKNSITGYRDRAFVSPCTGTTAPVYHTPWWEEFDDSMSNFLTTSLVSTDDELI